jgi:uncharacterized protein
MPRYRGKYNHLGRRISERVLDTLLCGGIFAKWNHRAGLHGGLSVTKYAVSLPPHKTLPRPQNIAFASDFHAGPTTCPAVFAKLFEAIHAHQPDILLLGGDFVSCKASYVQVLLDGLTRCTPAMGKYAVFGNHDLWTDDQFLTHALQSAAVEVLVNRHVTLPPPFQSISLCGMDDPWTGNADASLTFANSNDIRLLLMHAPDGLLLLDDNKFDLGFAGHTHGGQVALSDGTPILLPHGPLCRAYAHGQHDVTDNGKLIVSRGVGCSTLPVRINAAPELVICTLS